MSTAPAPEPPEVPELPKPALLNSIKGAVGPWIAAADLKATALLAVAGAIAALSTPAFIAAGGEGSPAARLALAVFAVLDIFTIGAATLVLWPRTNRAKILKSKNKKDNVWLPRSVTFFGDLAKLDAEGFRTFLLASEQNQDRDAYEQTLILCTIAQRKMGWMKAAIVFLCLTLSVLVFVMVAASISAKESVSPSPSSAPAPAPQAPEPQSSPSSSSSLAPAPAPQAPGPQPSPSSSPSPFVKGKVDHVRTK